MVRENEQSAEPQNDGDEGCTEELGERVRQVITAVDAVEGSAGSIDQRLEPRTQFILGIEPQDDTQPQKGLVDGREDLCVLLLSARRSTLEAAPEATDKEDRKGHEKEHKEGQLPRDDKEGDEIDEDHNRILEEDIQSRHDRRLDLGDIIRHAGDHISAPCLREIAHGQGENLIIQLLPQIAQDTRSDGHHEIVRQPCRSAFESGHKNQESPQEKQDITRAVQRNLVIQQAIEVSSHRRNRLLQAMDGREVCPLHINRGQTEQNTQYRDDRCKREEREHRREHIEQDVQCHQASVWRDEATEDIIGGEIHVHI